MIWSNFFLTELLISKRDPRRCILSSRIKFRPFFFFYSQASQLTVMNRCTSGFPRRSRPEERREIHGELNAPCPGGKSSLIRKVFGRWLLILFPAS